MDENLSLDNMSPASGGVDLEHTEFSPAQYFGQPELPEDPRRRKIITIVGAVAVIGGLAAGAIEFTGSNSHDHHAAVSTTQTTGIPDTAPTLETHGPSDIPSLISTPPPAPKTNETAVPSPSHSQEQTQDGLRALADLPGYEAGQEVPTQYAEMLRQSMVKVMVGADFQVATGVKIEWKGENYVLFAAHPLDLVNDNYTGGGSARNVTKDLVGQFGIATFLADGKTGPFITADPINGVGESQESDVAVMKINASDPNAHYFNAVPALNIADYLPSGLVAGQAAESVGLNTVGLNKTNSPDGADQITTAGNYLGHARHSIIAEADGINVVEDSTLIGLPTTTNNAQNPVYPGNSGMLGVISTKLANGTTKVVFTGPLSFYLSPNLPNDKLSYQDINQQTGVDPSNLTIAGYAPLNAQILDGATQVIG